MGNSGLSGRVKVQGISTGEKKAALFNAAAKLGNEYLNQLATANLSLEESEVAVLGYYNELNVVEQLQAGEDPENLKLLIIASKKDGFDINEYFDETGSYLDYSKIQEFLNK